MTRIDGISIPDSTMARQATELVRDTATPLLFNHSSRVYCFASLSGERQKIAFDPELLYIASMFHDLGRAARGGGPGGRGGGGGAGAARGGRRRRGSGQQ